MSDGAAGGPWEQPFYWWGPPWAPANSISLAELVGQGMIQAEQAAFLTAHIGAGGSLVVAALQSGTGRSTLAHALIGAIDPDRSLVYIRGTYEPFDWLASSEPDQTTLLVNEISDHLPVYCWGDCAKVVLSLAGSGYQVIATLHADLPESFLALLRSPGIGASEAEIVALDTVVFLDITGSGTRCVTNIMTISMDPEFGRTVLRPIDL
jgi:type IV secretory pathway ATPase VirB11/archaellum biosynthesis ATPase